MLSSLTQETRGVHPGRLHSLLPTAYLRPDWRINEWPN